MMQRHPIQPLETDAAGVLRFKKNAIVEYLLDNGGMDMNTLATKGFTPEDRMQFAQLIGYSLDGYGSLGYVTNESYSAAAHMHNERSTEDAARIAALQAEVASLRVKINAALEILE